MSRVLGIDYGDKRVGIALSDPSRIIASALSVLDNSSRKKTIRAILDICNEYEVNLIVIGLPLNMDGSSGPAVEKVRVFIAALEKRTDIQINPWDERLSTVSANNALIEAGTRREKRKLLVDKVAAQIILQHFLDTQIPDHFDENSFSEV